MFAFQKWVWFLGYESSYLSWNKWAMFNIHFSPSFQRFALCLVGFIALGLGKGTNLREEEHNRKGYFIEDKKHRAHSKTQESFKDKSQ